MVNNYFRKIFNEMVITGNCPECHNMTALINIDTNIFKCVACGEELEQKVNGVIKYMKVDKNTKMSLIDPNGQEEV